MTPGISTYCRITNNSVSLNGKPLEVIPGDGSWLTRIYHTLELGYPKFFKMDNLCKAGFLASALILEEEEYDHDTPKPDTSIIFMNRSSSLDDDTAYEKTIAADNYYPSPAVFVYTLANIVTGEVAIRYKITGQTSFYVTEKLSAQMLNQIASQAFSDPAIDKVLCGWTEFMDGNCDCFLMMLHRNSADGIMEFTTENINNLYKE